jgi:hypothetical protein
MWKSCRRLSSGVDHDSGLTHWQHPSFFGYFPAACTFEGMLADLYASNISNPGFNVSSFYCLDTGRIAISSVVVVIKSCVHGVRSHCHGLGSSAPRPFGGIFQFFWCRRWCDTGIFDAAPFSSCQFMNLDYCFRSGDCRSDCRQKSLPA